MNVRSVNDMHKSESFRVSMLREVPNCASGHGSIHTSLPSHHDIGCDSFLHSSQCPASAPCVTHFPLHNHPLAMTAELKRERLSLDAHPWSSVWPGFLMISGRSLLPEVGDDASYSGWRSAPGSASGTVCSVSGLYARLRCPRVQNIRFKWRSLASPGCKMSSSTNM
jgi:hypothetical protein